MRHFSSDDSFFTKNAALFTPGKTPAATGETPALTDAALSPAGNSGWWTLPLPDGADDFHGDPDNSPNGEFSRKPVKVVRHTEADKGKTAYYATAYENSKGEKGPWSPVVEAVIA
jgi:hypothetical protein